MTGGNEIGCSRAEKSNKEDCRSYLTTVSLAVNFLPLAVEITTI